MSHRTIKVKALLDGANYTNFITDGKHEIFADEIEAAGGQDKGMTPKQFLGGSLASCTTITLKMYADRKEWPVRSIEVEVDCTHLYDQVSVIDTVVTIDADMDEFQLERMLVIAKKCPIHKLLARSSKVNTVLRTA